MLLYSILSYYSRHKQCRDFVLLYSILSYYSRHKQCRDFVLLYSILSYYSRHKQCRDFVLLYSILSLSTIFHLYNGGQFCCCWKPEYLEKTDLPKVTDKFDHIQLYRGHLPWAGFELTMLLEIGADCIYHTMTVLVYTQLYRWCYGYRARLECGRS